VRQIGGSTFSQNEASIYSSRATFLFITKMFLLSALTSNQEIGLAEMKREKDEAKSWNIYARIKGFLFQSSGQEIRVAKMNGESGESEFWDDYQHIEETEAVVPKTASTLGLETPVDSELEELEDRKNGWIFGKHRTDWYQRQRECFRESDQRGEAWLWEAGGDTPA
jgi:hypothetical protein